MERSPFLGIPRRPVMRQLGAVWRLRELLLGADGRLYRAGSTIRVAKQPDHYSEQSQLAAARRRAQLAALRSGFSLGGTVNYDTALIFAPGSEQPDAAATGLVAVDGRVLVRWGAQSQAPLLDYLDDAVGLLLG